MSLFSRLFRRREGSAAKMGVSKEAPKEKIVVAKCPYCETLFEKAPTRKKKCPSCGNTIRVRSGRLYTEEGFEKSEEEERQKLIQNLIKSNRDSLTRYKKSGIKSVKILAAIDENTCENCRKWNSKKIPIDQAIREDILPIKNCTSDWCRCTYIPVVKIPVVN